MARAFVPKVLTASDLLEGDVIYWTKSGEWSRNHDDAVLFQDEQSANGVLSEAEKDLNLVGPYLADARISESGQPEPVHFREVFRTRGPSNYLHGKQTEA